MDERTQSLSTGLKTRHLTMMGLGSAIGAGLFLGTGAAINVAGPAVLLSYAAAGLLVVLVMWGLGEMSAARPESGSFSTYAELAFGRLPGFVTGWLYWYMLVMVMGAELTGAAQIVGGWFGVDPWIPAMIAMVGFTFINLTRVANFGEFEFWFAFIKVAVIIAFLVIGALLVFGWLPNTDAPGLSNLLHHGGFMPNGWSGVAAGLLAVAFAFGGIELVTIAAAESGDPATAVRRAVRSVVGRIVVFYLGSVLIIALLLPWDTLAQADEAAQSPFTAVLSMAKIDGIVGVMEVVIVIALLSAFNAQMYGTSRMMYALCRRGAGPRALARVNGSGVPTVALLVSVTAGFLVVLLNFLEIKGLLTFLLNAVGATLLFIWGMSAAAQLKLRREFEAAGELPVRMWAYPYSGFLALALLAALTVLMLTDGDARTQLVAMVVVVLVLSALGVVNQAVDRRRVSVGRRD
ncbi:amino acid permease [Gordonia sp. CPCC 205333]|uniref:amino acid permease n=1 Tax=Gordonia sp. CPCC 205333 TaxID=3140790 RepID=UPI003AF3893B